ncbi:MAG: gliding motility-associated C-terminal domain-containing protein [Bacteroidota bacterium]
MPTPVVLSPIVDLQNCDGDTIPVSIELDDDIQSYTIVGSGAFANDQIVGNNTLTFLAIYTGNPSTFDVTLVGNTTSCSVTESFAIHSCLCVPAGLTSVTVIEATCGQSDGFAMVKVEGAESDYTYTWMPDEGTELGVGNARDNLPVGAYEVQITNLNDPTCFRVVEVLVSNEDGPNATVTTMPASCSSSDGTATLTPALYNYLWEDGSTESSRTDLAPGIYSVAFTHPADPNCPNVLQVTIEENNTLTANAQIDVQPDCGSSNGTVTINGSGGSGNYSYSWSSGGSNQTETGLAAGMYTVTITDNVGTCSLPFSFVLADDVNGAVVSINNISHESCVGANDGFVDFSPNYDPGFIFPADVVISDGNTTFTNGNLPPGDYCIRISDANGCLAGGNCFTIDPAEELSLLFVIDPSCGGAGSIELTPIGGMAPYVIDWADLPGTDNLEDRAELLAGDYAITVTDANACTREDIVTVTETCPCVPPQINSIVTVESQCGETSGSAVIHLTTNEGGYDYTWTPDIGVPAEAGNVRTNLPSGGYTVAITDTSDVQCSTTVQFVVSNMNGPDPVIVTSPATCEGADGTASLSPANWDFEWEDGNTDAARTDLAAGPYFVTITDPNNPTCPNVVLVEIESDQPLQATTNVTVAPDCGVANGTVELNVSGGSGNYTFIWEDGLVSTSNSRSGLMGGLYTVIIRDNDGLTNCELSYTFVLANSNPTAILSITDTMDITCHGALDGGIDYTINYDASFNGTPDTIISNGQEEFENGNLPPGDYCIYILDDADCIAGAGCFSIVEPAAMSLLIEVTPECEIPGLAEVSVMGGTSPYLYNWGDLAGTNDPEDRNDLSVGNYQLTVTDDNGCFVIENSIAVPDCSPDTCDYFFGLDTFAIQSIDCSIGAQVCLDIPLEDLADFTVHIDGVIYQGNFEGCNWDTIVTYPYFNLFGQGAQGPYDVVSWSVGDTVYSGTFQTIADLVDSMNTWVPSSIWMLNTDAELISGGDPGLGFGAMLVDAIDFGVSSALTPDFAGVPMGLSIEVTPGTHEIIIRDTVAACSDTLMTNVLCTNADTIFTDVNIFEMDTICFSNQELFGEIDTLFDICGNLSHTTFEVYNDSCVIFTGTSIGVDTACIVYCDAFDICDTTIVIIDVLLPYDLVIDSICINETVQACIDTTQLELRGELVSMRNVCPDESGVAVAFSLDAENYCVSYTALSMGIDTACIEICDVAGRCDTVQFFIEVGACANTTPETIVDTIFINQTDTFCVDRMEVPGELLMLDNFCGELSTGAVDFFIDPNTLCVEYTGLELGKDTACVVLCNEQDICDTTFFCVLVEPYFDPPMVNDDVDTTNIGTPVVIDIKANDILFGGLDTAYILTEPIYGTATLNLDCSLTYNPGDEFCERSDELTYVACTPNGCDTATVTIWIACVDIVIFNAVSANRDGINDVFYIAGIEDFPDSELIVYNRWGNVVYTSVGYKNDWRGTWDGDKDLPDGTYFYLLRLNDEEDRSFKGYLELYR